MLEGYRQLLQIVYTSPISTISRCSGVRNLQRLFSLIETWKTKPHFNWQLRMDMSSENSLLCFAMCNLLLITAFNSFASVLKTLETRIYGERECTTPRWHHNLKNKWWHKIVPYVLYASACGSLSAVKYFIASGQEPTIRYLDKQSVS